MHEYDTNSDNVMQELNDVIDLIKAKYDTIKP